jgi:hypothetical protein
MKLERFSPSLRRKNSMNDFSKSLHEIREKMLREGWYFIRPEEKGKVRPNYSHINDSFCGVFSGYVCEMYGDQVEELCEEDVGISKKYTEHWFIKYQGKYYDAECIEGVIDPKDLPLFKFVLKKQNRTLKEKIKNLTNKLLWILKNKLKG